MIAIVNYKMGNLRSVENALSRLGADFKVTENAEVIKNADRVLLPGVGHAAEAMNNLSEAGLTDIIRNLRCPVLGICVGMQHRLPGDFWCSGKTFSPVCYRKSSAYGMELFGKYGNETFSRYRKRESCLFCTFIFCRALS